MPVTLPNQDPNTIEPHKFLMAEDVMLLLNVSRSKLHHLTFQKQNPLPSVRLGKARRFPRDKVLSWMNTLEK